MKSTFPSLVRTPSGFWRVAQNANANSAYLFFDGVEITPVLDNGKLDPNWGLDSTPDHHRDRGWTVMSCRWFDVSRLFQSIVFF